GLGFLRVMTMHAVPVRDRSGRYGRISFLKHILKGFGWSSVHMVGVEIEALKGMAEFAADLHFVFAPIKWVILSIEGSGADGKPSVMAAANPIFDEFRDMGIDMEAMATWTPGWGGYNEARLVEISRMSRAADQLRAELDRLPHPDGRGNLTQD